jgi:hypothetical protein
MSGLRSLGRRTAIGRIALAGVFCLLLAFVWGLLPDGAQAAGQKLAKPGKPPAPNCYNLTAAAVFRDQQGDGLRSDSLAPYTVPLDPDYYFGSPSEYHGWEDSLVCLMENDDYDFIMGTSSIQYELNGFNRMVTLDFGTQPVPYASCAPYEVLIRADYITNMSGGPLLKRLIVWFTANRVDYKLYFDDNDNDTDMVQVTVTGTAPNRIWTVVSNGHGRLEGPRRVGIVGHFNMPFQIAIHETDKPRTCL